MVVTRRGVRVFSPAKTTADPASDEQASPLRGRTNRSAESQSQCTHLEKSDNEHPVSPASSLKRCSRASRLHSPEQPATPLGSTRDTDESDGESSCSVVSDMETPLTRSKRRARLPRRVCRGDGELSDAESCSSAVSASSAGWNARQSARRKSRPQRFGAGQGAAKVDSAVSARVTRNQTKRNLTRSSTKRTDDSEHSNPDSHLSGVSGADVPKSTNRRAARPRRETGPIPIDIGKAEECTSLTLTPVRQSSRVAARRKTLAAAEVSEPQSCDSEGFESGPTYSSANRWRRAAKILDSDSDLTDVQSPGGSSCSKRSSSRASLRSKSPEIPLVSGRWVKSIWVGEKKVQSAEDTSLDESRLETTVIAGDAEVTLLEERVDMTEEKDVEDAAAAARQQQEELCEETQKEDTVDLEELRETASSEPPKTEIHETRAQVEPAEGTALDDSRLETTVIAAAQVADADEVQGGKDDHAAAVEPQLCEEEEEMEAAPVDSDDQQAPECFQVASSQEHVKVDPVSEEEPEVITIQKKEVISLLDSEHEEEDEDDEEEEDEDEEEEEDEDEEEDELGEVSDAKEERGGPSPKRGAADMAVDGLFMIDTRPGQEVDEQYYIEKATEEEKKTTEDKAEQEEEEEFVDEEGSDDETDILYSSRNPLLKEMSSRIDPGIRMKELGGLYINFDGGKSKAVSSSLPKLKEKKIPDEVMKKSVIGADFEKKDAVPPYRESKHALKLKRRVEREKTTGDGWFNMKAPEMSQELKGDLQVLKMRGSLDPKRFYKKNDRDGFPKYFQVGTVVDSPVDFYHSRVPKKSRKRTMVEELLADAEFRHKNKKKYQQIVAEKTAQAAGKNKRRFHKKANMKKQ